MKIQDTRYKIQMFLLLVLVPCILGFTAGCARTVTQIINYGDQMIVEVTMRGTIDVNTSRYFLVIGTGEGFKVPLPLPDNIDFEFIEPDMIPQRGAIADYFTNYFNSWAGYIITQPAGYFLVDGPFIQGQALTRESLSTLGEINEKIRFVLRLSQIFGNNVPNTIYFDVSSVAWPNSEAKMAADHLNSTNAYISKISGSTVTISDELNPDLPAARDISSCTVTIQ